LAALFSEHWHAVRFLRPRLREGVKPLFRRLRGHNWVLLQDPLTGRFHRLSPPVWEVVALLNGKRTLDEVWAEAVAQGGQDERHAAITQHELVRLMGSLYSNDLLQSQVSPDAEEVFERHKRVRRTEFKQSWLNPMSIKLPLLYPDAWFERRAALARRLFSWTALFFWLALVAPAVALAWQHWSALTENLSDRVLSASNLALLWLVYPLAKAFHECAHGLAVKAWGGTVREVGLMFVLFVPVPYVDATSSYRFDSKWQRAAVAAAGIMAELLLGAVALYVWLNAQSGVVTAIAYNVVLIAGFSTLVVNGNPLMRFDGYYVLSDLIEIPNLVQRCTQYWTYLSDRYLLGSPDAQEPMGAHAERWWLLAYGAVAPLYRLGVTIGLIWFVAGQYFWVGVVMALIGAWTSLVMPLWRGWKHLRDSPALASRRDWAKRRIFTLLALAGVLLLAVPMPFYAVRQGVMWLPDEAVVRAPVTAHVASVHAASQGSVQRAVLSGQVVERSQPLLQLESLTITSELAVAAGELAQAEAQLRQAEVDDPAKAQTLRADVEGRRAKWLEQLRREQDLRVVAASSGVWQPAGPTVPAGRFVKRGELIGYVVHEPAQRVRVAVTQEDMDLIARRARTDGIRADVRLPYQPAIPARLHRALSGGEQQLVSPALGTNGGGEIAVDPQDTQGVKPLHRVFDLELLLDHAPPNQSLVFGNRCQVRFDLGATPLGWQWLLRLRQLFLGQMSV
jgi:putative peptide zinc metalloprotease protein